MKFLLLSLVFIFSITQANASKCHSAAQKYFEEQGPESSDIVKNVEAHSYALHAHSPLFDFREQFIAIYNEEVEVFRGIGSEHSGWFESAIIVNPVTCRLIQIAQMDAE
jgi:hypothetical protein